MLPRHVDGEFHIVCQDDELRWPAVVIGAKCNDVNLVNLSHSGRKIAKKAGKEQGGFGLPLSERVSIWIEIEMTSKSEARRGQSVPFLGHLLGEYFSSLFYYHRRTAQRSVQKYA